jgi:hypothetical protein
MVLIWFLGKPPLEPLTDAIFIFTVVARIVITLRSPLLPNKITYSGFALALIVRLLLSKMSSPISLE